MQVLLDEERDKVVQTALSFLERAYARDFRCTDFVRQVYWKALGIEVPKFGKHAPPREFNITAREVRSPKPGSIIFLKDRYDPRKERSWTHVVIALPDNTCIHCSLFAGDVRISSLAALMAERYDFAESTPA